MESPNPYAAPSQNSIKEEQTVRGRIELASRSTRLLAALCDGGILAIINIPVLIYSGHQQRIADGTAAITDVIFYALFPHVMWVLINIFPLWKRGQTVGKMICKIQIVDAESNKLLPILNVFVFRYLWSLPLLILPFIFSPDVSDLIVVVFLLFDSILIFGADRRCLHDYIAGSNVVEYHHLRSRTSPGIIDDGSLLIGNSEPVVQLNWEIRQFEKRLEFLRMIATPGEQRGLVDSKLAIMETTAVQYATKSETMIRDYAKSVDSKLKSKVDALLEETTELCNKVRDRFPNQR